MEVTAYWIGTGGSPIHGSNCLLDRDGWVPYHGSNCLHLYCIMISHNTDLKNKNKIKTAPKSMIKLADRAAKNGHVSMKTQHP